MACLGGPHINAGLLHLPCEVSMMRLTERHREPRLVLATAGVMLLDLIGRIAEHAAWATVPRSFAARAPRSHLALVPTEA